MIKIENVDIWGFEHAIRGMRNPLNSWNRSDNEVVYDSFMNINLADPMTEKYLEWNNKYNLNIKIGPNNLNLMHRLYNAGAEHRKYLRQIFISMDITAPLYWWKEFDTYKVGTVANSCSTMHKITAKEFDLNDFSYEHLREENLDFLELLIDRLNTERKMYNLSKCSTDIDYSKDIWWQMIQLLPSSYNQKRTITMNYENAISMIHQRSGHKLDEWNEFIGYLCKLPYIEEITGGANVE